MSSFLISKLRKKFSKENITFILNIKNEEISNDISKFILSKKDKDAVLFLIQHDKIPKSLSLYLFRFIVNNKYWDMFLDLDYNKFDIHDLDDYAIKMSSEYGQIEVVKFLIEKGADIHADDDYALRHSSYNGHIEVVKFLIENGANIHAEDDEALRWSSSEGHFEVVKFLVEKGANVRVSHYGPLIRFSGNTRTWSSDNALTRSSNNGHIEITKYLLNADLEYFSKNEKAIEIVKNYKLYEFYEKFGIYNDFPQHKSDILKYIKSQDLDSLKKCSEFDFSVDNYFCFFKALVLNNDELVKVIFNKIENKEELNTTFDNISPFFDDNIKNRFVQLYKNTELEEIKNKLEKLLNEIKL